MRSFIISTVCISAFLITGADQVFSQDSWNMELIGKAAYDGDFRRFIVHDNYMYVATEKSNPPRGIFTVVDISDPDHPRRIGMIHEGARIQDFLIVDSLLYMSLKDEGVIIYDIQDPSAPIELAAIEENSGFGWPLKEFNGYIGSSTELGFNIIDISDPLEPEIANTIPMYDFVYDFEFYGDYLLLAEGLSNFIYLDIYDISDVADITQIYYEPIDSAYTFVGLEIVEDYAYLYHGFDGIRIYDIGEPASPEIVNTVFGEMRMIDVITSGDILFATTYSEEILSVDISDPVDPVLLDAFAEGDAGNLCLQGDMLEFYCSTGVLSLLDVTDPENPQPRGEYLPGMVTRNRISRYYDYIYSDRIHGGLRIFDASDPTDPFLVNHYYYPSQSHYTFVHNNLLFFTDHSNGILIYSLDDPSNPELLETVYHNSIAGQIFISGSYLYVPCFSYGFQIFDVSVPGDAYLIGAYESRHSHDNCLAIVEHAGYVYTAESDSGVGIYDVSDHTNPVKIAAYSNNGHTRAIFYKDDILYVANGTGGFIILDVSNPFDPSLMSIVEGGWIYDVFVGDDIAFVADRDSSLKAYDVTDPYSPELIGTYDDYGRPSAVFVENDTVYVSALEGGLWILRYDETVGIEDGAIKPREFQLDQNHPNPFNAKTVLNYSLPESGVVTLSIYNILGQQVMTLSAGEKAAGKHTIAWDASTFPSGVYFARLETQDVSKTIKMVLLK